MSGPPTSRPSTDRDDADTWPWACLDCGATIYHDGEFCVACESSHRIRRAHAESERSNGFRAWMREQTATDLVLKTTLVAAIELGLTTVWLQALLRRSLELGSLVPVIS